MDLFAKRWIKMSLFGLIGLTAGYAYYYFIGCTSGSCPLTSNPLVTSGYGLGAGLLLGWDSKPKKNNQGG